MQSIGLASLVALVGACAEPAAPASAPQTPPRERPSRALPSAVQDRELVEQAKPELAPERVSDEGTITGGPPKAPRPFLNGDIIFHEANSDQSELVRRVTRSNWTHLGVIWNGEEGPVVYEAAAPVKATPLQAWVNRGKGGSYVVKRLTVPGGLQAGLDETATTKMQELVQKWMGLPYDYRFRWDDAQMYCSEFVYKLYERGAGSPVGALEKASDMALDDPLVQMIIKSHWGKAAYNPHEPVVTPDSIFRDPRLIEVEP